MFLYDMNRSESSTTNADELKRIKSILSDLQSDLEDSQSEIDKKLESMESNITDLQSRYTQMETRFERWGNDMKDVSVIHFSHLTSLFCMCL